MRISCTFHAAIACVCQSGLYFQHPAETPVNSFVSEKVAALLSTVMVIAFCTLSPDRLSRRVYFHVHNTCITILTCVSPSRVDVVFAQLGMLVESLRKPSSMMLW